MVLHFYFCLLRISWQAQMKSLCSLGGREIMVIVSCVFTSNINVNSVEKQQ